MLLAACGGNDDQPSSASWRNVDVDLPDGWYLVEDEETRFTIASHDLHEVDEDGVPVAWEGDVVAMFFTYEPGTVPDDWRGFVQQQGGELETDRSMVLGEDTPATQLVFSYETNGIPTREMVVVIPSRHIVVLSQPVPGPGDTDGPEVFLEHIDLFLDVLESARFGSPVLD
jgi:hypothetical protein